MEALSFCCEIIKREGEKFNVGIDATIASQITAATATNVNYDIAHNRCSYLYRCGPINLCFAKDCFTKFFSSYKGTDILLLNWVKNSSQTTICSLSKGPALDYIAFLSSYHEYIKCYGDKSLSYLSPFKNVKLISKYGAWRNSVNIVDQLITEGYKSLSIPESFGSYEVIQGDPFANFTEKLKNPINESDAVIMMKTFNLQADGFNANEIISLVKGFIFALKKDTVLFCIDTKPSIALITKAISAFSGTFLFQPTFVNTLIQLDHIDLYKAVYGCSPVLSARGSFFVWQKKSNTLPSPSNLAMNGLSELIKTLPKISSDSGYCDKVPKIDCDSGESVNDAFYCSTPTHLTQHKNKVFPSSESLKFEVDQLFDDCYMNTASQNTECSPSSSSSQNGCEYLLESDSAATAVPNNLASADKSMQIAPEKSFDSIEAVKIAALTEKISNLTLSLKNLLEKTEVQDFCFHCQSCLKSRNDASVNSVASKCSSVHCSSEALFLNRCCNEGLQNCDSYLEKMARKQYCSDHLHKRSSSHCNQYSSNASLCDHETNENCNSSSNIVNISTEQKSVPKLVIPLNNLSGDVIAQIVSLISNSNNNP